MRARRREVRGVREERAQPFVRVCAAAPDRVREEGAERAAVGQRVRAVDEAAEIGAARARDGERRCAIRIIAEDGRQRRVGEPAARGARADGGRADVVDEAAVVVIAAVHAEGSVKNELKCVDKC